MAFEVKLEEGERLIAHLALAPLPGAFQIAISDRAVFLPRTKAFAVKDPSYCERVPLNQITQAKVKKLSPYLLWVLAVIMVLVGVSTTIIMLVPILAGSGGRVSGIPPAVAVVGLVIPFLARRRFGLSISMANDSFLWKPPLSVDRASRDKTSDLLSHAADALRQAGVTVINERVKTSPGP